MKPKLLAAVAAGQAREAELVALCVDEPVPADGAWRAKDHVAHLATGRVRYAQELDVLRSGGLPAEVDQRAQNDKTYAANRDCPAVDIIALARLSWERVKESIESCTEDDLRRPHPKVARAELWNVVAGNMIGHLADHLGYWYTTAGDEAAAEQAHRWDYEVEARAAPDGRAPWYVSYNLACFYGLKGRADDAVPLLSESFERDPSLVAHARKDSDLDPIRDDPRVKELLAT